MASSQRFRRSEGEYFDSHSYYRFHHRNRPNKTLATTDPTGRIIDMFPFTTLSSENWQLYYQQGRWFIRPYATSSVTTEWVGYQLGLTEDSQGNVGALPSLKKRSGELGQQWTFTQVDDGEGGYGYRLSNGLLGNQSYLSLTGGDDGGRPAMQSSVDGSVWDIQINPSAQEPANDNSYQDAEPFKVAPSSTRISSAPSSTWTPTSKLSPSASAWTTARAPTPTETHSASGSLGTGAIVGMAVGLGVLAVLTAAGAVFFFLRRRKSKHRHAAVEVAADAKVVYAYEIDSPPVVHMAQEKGFQQPIYELETGAASGSAAAKAPGRARQEGEAT